MRCFKVARTLAYASLLPFFLNGHSAQLKKGKVYDIPEKKEEIGKVIRDDSQTSLTKIIQRL